MVDKEMSADSSDFGTGSDLFKLWKIMMDAKIIPEDAAAAIILLIGCHRIGHLQLVLI